MLKFLIPQILLFSVLIYLYINETEENAPDLQARTAHLHLPPRPHKPTKPNPLPSNPPNQNPNEFPYKHSVPPEPEGPPESYNYGSDFVILSPLTLQSEQSFTTDNNIQVIFSSNRQNMELCRSNNTKTMMLCKLGLSSHCMRHHLSEELSSFWIICPIYSANHVKTALLYTLHSNFRDYIRSLGINFQTVETIFPGQKFHLTRPNHEPYELQYRDNWIFAMRENLVNVGIKHLPDDWQYMAWIDQHIYWEDQYWFEKSIWLMSHHNINQLLNGSEFLNVTNGTMYHLESVGKKFEQYGYEAWRHDPKQWGLAWAMRKEVYEKVGNLLDICIGTKCDLYQVFAYLGGRYTEQTGNADYANAIGKWQDHAKEVYNKDIGYLKSKVYHFVHCIGTCQTSNYDMQIWLLKKHNYNPLTDLKRDEEGRLSLVNNEALARDLWRAYGGEYREY